MKEEIGFYIRTPPKYKIIDGRERLPSPEELDIDYPGDKWWIEQKPHIHIKGISVDAFDEVCENPDILIIK